MRTNQNATTNSSRLWINLQPSPRLLAAILAPTLAIALASHPAAAQSPTPQDVGANGVATCMNELAHLNALSITADVTLTLHEPIAGSSVAVGEPITGTFTYQALGDMWRKTSNMDPAKYPGMNTTVAYDGQWFSYAMPDYGVTSVSASGDNREPGVVLPNPIIALSQFFAPTSDDSNDVRLVDARSLATAGATPTTPWQFIDTDQGRFAYADFPGAVTAGQGYLVRVYVPENSDMPSSIERRTTDGQLLTRTTFENYVSHSDSVNTSMSLPTVVRFEGFNPQTGQLAAEMEMNMNQTDIDPAALTDATFSPDWANSQHIWADEAQGFIK